MRVRERKRERESYKWKKSFDSVVHKTINVKYLLKICDSTVKLDYNDHGYNKVTAITNKNLPIF